MGSGQKGFSMVETVLYIVLSAIIVGVISQIMFSNVETYSFITKRENALSNARYALNRITGELIKLPGENFTGLAATRIDFTDDQGVATDYRQANNNEGRPAVYRGNEVLIAPIQSFTIDYLDIDGNDSLATPDNIRKIKFTITTAPEGNEGNLTLSTTIIPRTMVYENYQ